MTLYGSSLISAFEIVMPTETPESLMDAMHSHQFPNSVKSAWVIAPKQRATWLMHPNQPAQLGTHGSVHDPASDFNLSVDELFA